MSTALITREWEGKTLTFREDGYFNMTKAAKQFGKRLDNFKILPTTREYVADLSLSLKISEKDLLTTQKGNGNLPQVGTWGHPKLAVFFARWLDVRFARACDAMIDDILRGKADFTVTQPETASTTALPQDYLTALEALVESVRSNQQLTEMNQALTHENRAMSEELNSVSIDEYRALTHRYFDRRAGA